MGKHSTSFIPFCEWAVVFNAGAGNDVLLVDSEDLQQNIHAGSGFDIVQVIGNQGVTLNLAQAEAEVAQGGDGNDVLIGGGRSTVYVRGGAGAIRNDEFDGAFTIRKIAFYVYSTRARGLNYRVFGWVRASNEAQWGKVA